MKGLNSPSLKGTREQRLTCPKRERGPIVPPSRPHTHTHPYPTAQTKPGRQAGRQGNHGAGGLQNHIPLLLPGLRSLTLFLTSAESPYEGPLLKWVMAVLTPARSPCPLCGVPEVGRLAGAPCLRSTGVSVLPVGSQRMREGGPHSLGEGGTWARQAGWLAEDGEPSRQKVLVPPLPRVVAPARIQSPPASLEPEPGLLP